MTKNKTFWLDLYAENVEPLNLPTDFAKPSQRAVENSVSGFIIAESDTKKLRALAKEEDTTLFMLLFSVYNVLLAKLTGQEDIVVGLPLVESEARQSDNSYQLIDELAVRNQFNGTKPFCEFLSALTIQTQSCFDHQEYAFEGREENSSSSSNSLFEVRFSCHKAESNSFVSTGTDYATEASKRLNTGVDLSLFAIDTEGEIELVFQYATDLFKANTIEQFAACFKTILHQIIDNRTVCLNDIELVSAAEKQQILNRFNDTEVAYPAGKTVMDLFRAQAERSPENVAMRMGHNTYSYKELDAWSDKIAAYLFTAYQARPGEFVGIILDREEWLVPVIFGILKAGCACIPIDPKYPPERVATIVEDSKLNIVITRSKFKATLNAEISIIDLDQEAAAIEKQQIGILPDLSQVELAYILYTSGSTGKPKGVMIKHSALSNIVQCMQSRYPLVPGDAFLFKTAITFDVSCSELFGWFIAGGTLVLPATGVEAEPEKILQTVADFGITHINFSPSVFSIILDVLESGNVEMIESLKYIILAGEALPISLVKRFEKLVTKAQVENLYGPTEGTVYSSGYSTAQLGSKTRMPIGKPLDNVRLYVINRQLGLQPAGVPGELCLGGKGLASGYLHNRTLTEERFINASFSPEEVIYRTGDLARWLPDGTLEYLGRLDHQVKLRGIRIELGEIEAQLAKNLKVKECVVKDFGEGNNKYLAAYYVSGIMGIEKELKAWLAERVPKYMVPGVFVALDQMPLNNSGKVDRKSLPVPELKAGPDYVSPVNETEEKLVEIWSEVLSVPGSIIGVEKSFYDLGGHSLSVAAMLNKVHRIFQMKFSFQDFFKKRTIRQMAEHIKIGEWLTDEDSLVDANEVTI